MSIENKKEDKQGFLKLINQEYTDKEFEELVKYLDLKKLYLNNCKINNIPNIKSLKVLKLYGTNANIKGCKQLEVLSLNNVKIKSLTRFYKLKFLFIRNNSEIDCVYGLNVSKLIEISESNILSISNIETKDFRIRCSIVTCIEYVFNTEYVLMCKSWLGVVDHFTNVEYYNKDDCKGPFKTNVKDIKKDLLYRFNRYRHIQTRFK